MLQNTQILLVIDLKDIFLRRNLLNVVDDIHLSNFHVKETHEDSRPKQQWPEQRLLLHDEEEPSFSGPQVQSLKRPWPAALPCDLSWKAKAEKATEPHLSSLRLSCTLKDDGLHRRESMHPLPWWKSHKPLIKVSLSLLTLYLACTWFAPTKSVCPKHR